MTGSNALNRYGTAVAVGMVVLGVVVAAAGPAAARDPLADQTTADFQAECGTSLTKYRGRHHAPALAIDPNLVEYAKSRAQLISQSAGLSHGHRGLNGHYGETLFWTGSVAPELAPCSAAVDNWYRERAFYDPNNPAFSTETASFTQVVWRDTTAVGCARAGGMGAQFYETYIVCAYAPPGNIAGSFTENVLAD
ncbi:CAP family protein [Nocardia sp. CA-128927]|uniref:CAP family protein n=1 Tax=Nocardia sp. CA-128927 TaxID=3239975 RepID=UPI003D965E4F